MLARTQEEMRQVHMKVWEQGELNLREGSEATWCVRQQRGLQLIHASGPVPDEVELRLRNL